MGDAGGHFAGEKFGDGGVHAEVGGALEMTEGEERSLHYGRDDRMRRAGDEIEDGMTL